MNKLLTTLIAASLAALLLAVGCGTWLFWQSWEESKRLERQNRELQASLEASRIRLDNFCEYPMNALCDVDGQRGTVSDAMDILTESLPEPSVPKPSLEALNGATEKTAEASPSDLPGKEEAGKEEEHTGEASGGHTVSGKISLQPLPAKKAYAAPATIPAKTEDEKKSSSPTPTPGKQDPALVQKEGENTPASRENTKAGPSSENAVSDQTGNSFPEGQTADAVPEEKKEETSHAVPKKTWITLEQTPSAMLFRIAGAGNSLTAEGALREEPLRYEVTLNGRWKIAFRQVNTKLVKGMSVEFRNSDTVIVFPLSGQPSQCSVAQEDARTIAITLR